MPLRHSKNRNKNGNGDDASNSKIYSGDLFGNFLSNIRKEAPVLRKSKNRKNSGGDGNRNSWTSGNYSVNITTTSTNNIDEFGGLIPTVTDTGLNNMGMKPPVGECRAFVPSSTDISDLQLPRVQLSRRWSSVDGLSHRRSSKEMKLSSREIHMKALSDLQTATSRLPHPEVVYGAMIPEPDYSDDESEMKTSSNMVTRNNKVNSTNDDKEQEKPPPPQPNPNGRLDDKGLIMPKKLINPCLESTEKKSLHRELMFNQKMGVNVLNQKSELQKAMEKHNDKKILKEQEKEKKSQLTPFQKALDERAQRIEQMEKVESKSEEKLPSSEFEKIHAKVRAKMEVQ